MLTKEKEEAAKKALDYLENTTFENFVLLSDYSNMYLAKLENNLKRFNETGQIEHFKWFKEALKFSLSPLNNLDKYMECSL